MKEIVHLTAKLIWAGQKSYAKKWPFFGLFLLVFLGSVYTLASFDLLPNPSSGTVVRAAPDQGVIIDASLVKAVSAVELPIKVEIASIALSASIANPRTTDTDILDQKLLSGAVRYPESAKLGEAGNVVLFGHSSYLPIVGNSAYKTFNGIQKLKSGDMISVYSEDAVYVYRVSDVSKESVSDNTPIPLKVVGKKLTLVTCNSFATKSDRFVVVADFVESHSFPQ